MALQQGRYTLCCSNDILMEYEELLARFYTKHTAADVMNFIFYSVNVLMITPYYQWNLINADLDDNKFVDCALNAGADYIVTNDRHFTVLKFINFPSINVIDIDTFRKMLKK
jgi:predicted nucleic acid-binding protein